jgi:ferrochelatase
MSNPLAPFDSILFLSFGGPEGPDDVMPFLENVTRGRGIPRERLEEVAEHYLHFGGVSPINQQCRDLLAVLEPKIREAGIDQPIFWGNRNWDPYVEKAVAELHAQGFRKPLVLTTSAYSSYSSCRQYREDLARAAEPFGDEIQFGKVAQYFDSEGFIAANVTAVRAALESVGGRAPVVFVTHSLPTTMSETSGDPARDYGVEGAYVAQHKMVAQNIMDAITVVLGEQSEWSLAFCSRSGPASQPWLEPDVSDEIRRLKAEGHTAVVVSPIGFISDHMEVIYDLDEEAMETAEEVGITMARAATVGTDPDFVNGLVDLLLERAAEERGESLAGVRRECGIGRQPSTCAVNCCVNARASKPALCGQS